MVPSSVLLVKPAAFHANQLTLKSNAFQHPDGRDDELLTSLQATAEFEALQNALRNNGVNLIVEQDTQEPKKPDAIFPNNWVSFHENGTVVFYPMMAPNRRTERRMEILDSIKRKGFKMNLLVDLSGYEKDHQFLEGTGSMVLDREHRIAYACLSDRTHPAVLVDFCKKLDYKPVVFSAADERMRPVYHTNVMMCMGTHFVAVCLQSVRDAGQQAILRKQFAETNKSVIELDLVQMNSFAGNMIELQGSEKKPLLFMSSAAYSSLNKNAYQLEDWVVPVSVAIPTIEKNGGGSVRCMIAEVNLPRTAATN